MVDAALRDRALAEFGIELIHSRVNGRGITALQSGWWIAILARSSTTHH
ncbi:hypothetical protein IQ249_08655 [Lusitaniella coriacea LEGE 07157]|uniref:Uncharacterized protein n=1 Tax=Lusitaniella coriacea LEGE 07157 TaxID=945747 RepID=A0A8J7DYE5_9CYAN|nr:hypothetical protein [Lusitaniella coriacea]MBE9115961.1 hypothetical protein [Lusitaniella coriacea LEGE 07157]